LEEDEMLSDRVIQVDVLQNRDIDISSCLKSCAGIMSGALLSIATLDNAIIENIKWKGTIEQLDKINSSVGTTTATVRAVQQLVGKLLALYETPTARTPENITTLRTEAQALSERCQVCAEKLEESARLVEHLGKTTMLSFLYRCRWSVGVIGIGIALHFTPLVREANVVLAGGVSSVALTLIFDATKKINHEVQKYENETEEINKVSDALSTLCATLDAMASQTQKVNICLSGKDEWDQIRKIASEINELCNLSLDGARKIPLFQKDTCIVS
jgi:methyl-accepting chemotaxis protein